MQDIRLIVTDLDNTLLTSDKTISAYTASVLNQCQQRGYPVVFATARPVRAAARFFSSVTPDFVIANNGATILQGAVVLAGHPIEPKVAAPLLRQLRDEPAVTCMSAEVGHCLYMDLDVPAWEEGWNPVYHDFAELPEGEIVKISTECRNVSVVRKILAAYPCLHLYENNGEAWQQIIHESATKWNALQFIAGKLGISPTQTVAFGDDDNDVEMIRNCGVGVAVENAVPAVRQTADFICGHHDADGAAHWLEAYLLGEDNG